MTMMLPLSRSTHRLAPLAVLACLAARAAPAAACECAAVAPLSAETLASFDVVFRGTVRNASVTTDHDRCGVDEDEALNAYRVVVDKVWAGDVAADQVVVEATSSCAASLSAGAAIVVVGAALDGGVVQQTTFACSVVPSDDDLTAVFGDPVAPREGVAGRPCTGGCAAAPAPLPALLLPALLLWARRARVGRHATTKGAVS